MSKKVDLRVWIEGAIVAAVAMALSFIPIQTANSAFDLSLGLVPLVLYSYRRGALPGMVAGLVWGLLNIVIGTAMKNFVSVPQIIFEYPFAFAFGGLGGIFAKRIQGAIRGNNNKTAISFVIFGSVVAVVSRWFWHYWAGVFVWGAYAPDNMNPYLYSLIFNGASTIANIIYVSVVLVILVKAAPALFLPKKSNNVYSEKKV